MPTYLIIDIMCTTQVYNLQIPLKQFYPCSSFDRRHCKSVEGYGLRVLVEVSVVIKPLPCSIPLYNGVSATMNKMLKSEPFYGVMAIVT